MTIMLVNELYDERDRLAKTINFLKKRAESLENEASAMWKLVTDAERDYPNSADEIDELYDEYEKASEAEQKNSDDLEETEETLELVEKLLARWNPD